jgi:hypothetical protein
MPLTMKIYLVKHWWVCAILFMGTLQLTAQINICEQRYASDLQLYRNGQLFEVTDSLRSCLP